MAQKKPLFNAENICRTRLLKSISEYLPQINAEPKASSVLLRASLPSWKTFSESVDSCCDRENSNRNTDTDGNLIRPTKTW